MLASEMRVKVLSLLITLLVFVQSTPAQQRGIAAGGTLEFSFGDNDLTNEPGPIFGTYKYGTLAKLSLLLRNEYVAAGMFIEIPQGQKNVDYVDFTQNPLSGGDIKGSPLIVSSAFIRFREILEIIDITLDVEGGTLGIGEMVKSVNTTSPDKRSGVSVGLVPGSISDLVMYFVINQAPGTPPTPIMSAIRSFWGSQVRIGWEANSFSLYASALASDLEKYMATWAAGLNGAFDIVVGTEDELNIKGQLELSSCASTSSGIGLGSGVRAGLLWKGFGVNGEWLWKNDNFGKDTKILLIDSVADDFGSWATRSSALSGGLSLNPRGILGFDNLTLSGGYGQVLVGSGRSGWYCGADFNLNRLLGTTAVLGFSMSRYGVVTEAPFINSNVLWKVHALYDYHGVKLSGWYGVQAYDDPTVPGNEQSARPAFELAAKVSF